MVGTMRLAAATLAVAVTLGASPLRPVARWPLPAVGGISDNKTDHLLLSRSGDLLYVSAKSINTVFVLNTTDGHVAASLAVQAPQGLGITKIEGQDLLWVGSDGDGALSAFNLTSLERVHLVNFSLAADVGEADDIVVDDETQEVLVAVGDDGAGSTDPAAVATVDAHSGAVLASVPTPGHIEGFTLVRGTNLVVANSPHADPNAVLLIARNTSSVLHAWPMPAGTGGNTPLALDERTQRLLVGCREPPTLLVLADLGGGAVLASDTNLVADVDDLFVDPTGSGVVFASGGGAPPASPGAVSAYQLRADGTLQFLGDSVPAGKNSIPDWQRQRLYTAVPSSGPGVGAYVQVYAW